jgi:hypothetical protein
MTLTYRLSDCNLHAQNNSEELWTYFPTASWQCKDDTFIWIQLRRGYSIQQIFYQWSSLFPADDRNVPSTGNDAKLYQRTINIQQNYLIQHLIVWLGAYSGAVG